MFVLAQDAGSTLTGFLPILLIGAVFYFLLIRPQRKRQRQHNQMLEALEVGSEVVTIGGMYGEVEALDDNWVDVAVSEDVVVRLTRSAIGRIATEEDQENIERFVTGEPVDDDLLDEVWGDEESLGTGDLDTDESTER